MNGFCVFLYKDQKKILKSEIIDPLIKPILIPSVGKVKTGIYNNLGFAVYDHFNSDPARFIYTNDRLIVLCDAEIYNYKDFEPTKTDTEISEAKLIADLYLKNGLSWYKNVNGVFSVFIWDKKENKGLAFTDRIRTKPLVYYDNSEYISIASNIKSISAIPGFLKKLNSQAIFSYISMEMIPTPYSIYQGIKKLESGHVLKISKYNVTSEILWKMEYPEEKIQDEKELELKIYELTKKAIDREISYRNEPNEIGAFLSGGTDSSTIAGLINEINPGKAKTFSIGFDEQGYDEMYYARIAAKAFNTDHTEYYITTDDIFNSLPGIIEDFDEPFANSSVIPAYFCSKMAYDRGIKTMLGGDGGDEIFGGNARYHKYFADFQRFSPLIVDSLYPLFKKLPQWANKSVLRKVNNYLKRAKATLAETIHAYNLFHYVDPEIVFNKDFLKSQLFTLPMDISQGYIDQTNTNDTIDQYLYHDLKITLMDNDLPKVNRMTQLANVNIRYPFLYPELVEFTGLIPQDFKVRDGKLRYIFKKAFDNLLPDEIINKTKHGFGLPIVPWMLKPGKLNDMLKDVLFDSKTKNRGIFETSFLDKFYKNSLKDSTPFYGTYLYYVLVLELWLRKHYDKN